MVTSQDLQPFRWHYDDLDDHSFQIRGRTLFFIIVLFSVVLLITLLFLYARWICRSPALPLAATSSAHGPSVGAHRGLDLDPIGSLPIVLHQPLAASINEVECNICLGILSEGEKLRVLSPLLPLRMRGLSNLLGLVVGTGEGCGPEDWVRFRKKEGEGETGGECGGMED